MIVLDTNVVSETVGINPSELVRNWLRAQETEAVFITSITQAELLLGIETLPVGRRRTTLAAAVEGALASEFQGRILPFDEAAARLFPKIVAGRSSIGRPISQSDAMIASICRSHHATLATRNVADFEHCGIRIVNPWER